METTILDENTEIGRAVTGGSDSKIAIQILACLKKLGISPKTVVEHGPGVNAAPAIAFLKKGLEYYGIEKNKELFSTFKEDWIRSLGTQQVYAHLFENDVFRIDLKRAIKANRPVMVFFYNSLGYVPEYAPNLGKKSIQQVIGRYADFLEQGDAMVCIWTVFPHQGSLDAEYFYEVIKEREFKKIVLITISRQALRAKAEVLLKRAYGKNARGAGAAIDELMQQLDRRAEPGRYLILGVIGVK